MNYYQMCQEELQNLSKNSDPVIIPYNYTGSQETWKYLTIGDYIQIFAYIILIVGGLLGNISVILTVILNESMKTTVNFYVTNLAVTDALICIICMIPHAVKVAVTDYFDIFGPFMCKFNIFTQMTCLISSVLTLSAISFNRFLVVVYPTEMFGVEQRTCLVISIIWIISTAVSIPLLFFKKLISFKFENNFIYTECAENWPVSAYYDEIKGKCNFSVPLRPIYYFILCISLYFLPVIIMIFAYSLIAWTVWNRHGMRKKPDKKLVLSEVQCRTNSAIYSRTRKKVTLMAFSVLVAFITCWTPFIFVLMLSALHDGTPLPGWFHHLKWASYYLAYSNSFINPFIYGRFNRSFRDGFCDILRCGFTRNHLGRLARSIQTITTHFTSSITRRMSRTSSTDKKTSCEYKVEMKVKDPADNGDLPETAKEMRIEVLETTKILFKRN